MWGLQCPSTCGGIAPAHLNNLEEGLIVLINPNHLLPPETPVALNRVENPIQY
jgi:hypothetical protein